MALIVIEVIFIIAHFIQNGHAACLGYAPILEGKEDYFNFSASSMQESNEANYSTLGTKRCWRPEDSDKDTAWLEVDLRETKRLGGMLTMGKDNQEFFVSSYAVMYRASSDHAWNFASVNGQQFLDGNRRSLEGRLNVFDEDILAQYVRLHILSYSEYPNLRWELFECATDIKPINLGPPNPAIEDKSTMTCSSDSTVLRWNELKSAHSAISVVVLGSSGMICDSDTIFAGISTNYVHCDDYGGCDMRAESGKCVFRCSLTPNVPFKLLLALNRPGNSLNQVCTVMVNANSNANWTTKYLDDGKKYYKDFLDDLANHAAAE